MRGDPFYKTRKWIKKRNTIMRKYSYECQESKRFGIRVQAEMIHH
ncbi:MAG: HNH endonuclease, partial [Enterococcus faecalis]|nr:HNH endonuclease [Enterococcus faecalis]